MKTSHRLLVLITVFALGAACWSGLGSSTAQEKDKDGKAKEGKAQAVGPASPKWDYKVTVLGRENDEPEKELNTLGDEGWELVGAASDTSANRGGGAVSTKVRLIFKRPKR